MRRESVVLLAAVALSAAACAAGDAARATQTAAGTASPPTSTAALPRDPDALFVRVGGAGTPAIAADGRVFRAARPAATGLRFAAAPPLAPSGPLEVARLGTAGLATVFAKALELDLLRPPPDYGDPAITDMGTLVVTIAVDGATYVHAVYAPGEPVDDPAAQAARDRLAEFVSFAESLHLHLDDELGPWAPYLPERWVVDVDAYVDRAQTAPWPFETSPEDGCAVLATSGERDTASGTYTLTSDGHESLVAVRPALPFEC
jgi:hypothetical protein